MRYKGHKSTVRTKQYDIALSTFEKIRAAFPLLQMKLDLEPNFVELAMDIPSQPGLLFHIDLNFQNLDELHLSVSALWVEWFPCTIPGESDEYFEAVSGLLSGEYRILEHWRGKRAVKAELQCPVADGWKSIKTSTHLPFLPWPRKVFKVVQNLPGMKSMAQNP